MYFVLFLLEQFLMIVKLVFALVVGDFDECFEWVIELLVCGFEAMAKRYVDE